MKETENNYSKTVLFTPEREDFIYLSRAITSKFEYSRAAHYLFIVFLLVNAIFVPGLLFFLDYTLIGAIIFLANIAVVIFLIPMNQKRADLEFFTRLYDDVGDHDMEVELSAGGLRSRCNGSETLLPWNCVTGIQESPDAIYFFTKLQGIPVRKSGFSSDFECKAFTDYARHNLRDAREAELGAKQTPSITG